MIECVLNIRVQTLPAEKIKAILALPYVETIGHASVSTLSVRVPVELAADIAGEIRALIGPMDAATDAAADAWVTDVQSRPLPVLESIPKPRQMAESEIAGPEVILPSGLIGCLVRKYNKTILNRTEEWWVVKVERKDAFKLIDKPAKLCKLA